MVRPCVARRFRRSGGAVLHQCIRPLIGALAPGHHGQQRACDLITGQASSGPFGSPVFARAGKTDPPSRRFLSQTSAGRFSMSLGACYLIPFLCSCRWPFLRPGLHIIDASRAGAVKAGRRAGFTPRTAIARPRLDGAEHGARIKRVGRPHHQSSSFRSHAPWQEPPRRCGRACWRARSPARYDATASCAPRSRI
jgi:hypothetical protein